MKQRKDGRYEVKVYLGKVDGIKKYKSVMGKTQAEVNKKAAELRVQLGQGVRLSESKAFSVWADRYLNQVEQTSSRDWYNLNNTRAKVWKDEFGDISVEKILPADCQEILNDIAKSNPYYPNKPTSYKTLLEYKNILCRIFDFCVQNRILTFNSANYLIIPKTANRGKRNAISDTEINAIWNTPHELQCAALISIFCGLRRGELGALTWSDIDLKNKTINVNKAVNPKDNTIKSPKTAAGVRSVPIPDKLCEYLKGIKKESLLVLERNGRQYNNNDWQVMWESYLRKIEAEQGIVIEATFHCLRHTYCTLLHEAGIDAFDAKVFMGHADINTTLGVYTHITDNSRNKSIVKLNNLLSPKEKGSAKNM